MAETLPSLTARHAGAVQSPRWLRPHVECTAEPVVAPRLGPHHVLAPHRALAAAPAGELCRSAERARMDLQTDSGEATEGDHRVRKEARDRVAGFVRSYIGALTP